MFTNKAIFTVLTVLVLILPACSGLQSKEIPVTLTFQPNESVDAFLGEPILLPGDISYTTTLDKVDGSTTVSNHPKEYIGDPFKELNAKNPKILEVTYDFGFADTGFYPNCSYIIENSALYDYERTDCDNVTEISVPVTPVFKYCGYTADMDYTLYCNMDSFYMTVTETNINIVTWNLPVLDEMTYIAEFVEYMGGKPDALPKTIPPTSTLSVPISVDLP